eukprot:11672503-Karenia_brevis.AAC.1
MPVLHDTSAKQQLIDIAVQGDIIPLPYCDDVMHITRYYKHLGGVVMSSASMNMETKSRVMSHQKAAHPLHIVFKKAQLSVR